MWAHALRVSLERSIASVYHFVYSVLECTEPGARVLPVPKEPPVKFLLRLSPEMLDRIRQMAEQERRSATQQIIQLLDEALAARDKRG